MSKKRTSDEWQWMTIAMQIACIFTLTLTLSVCLSVAFVDGERHKEPLDFHSLPLLIPPFHYLCLPHSHSHSHTLALFADLHAQWSVANASPLWRINFAPLFYFPFFLPLSLSFAVAVVVAFAIVCACALGNWRLLCLLSTVENTLCIQMQPFFLFLLLCCAVWFWLMRLFRIVCEIYRYLICCAAKGERQKVYQMFVARLCLRFA